MRNTKKKELLQFLTPAIPFTDKVSNDFVHLVLAPSGVTPPENVTPRDKIAIPDEIRRNLKLLHDIAIILVILYGLGHDRSIPVRGTDSCVRMTDLKACNDDVWHCML
jgi:hypothetical protein